MSRVVVVKKWMTIVLVGTATILGGVLGRRAVRSLFPRDADPRSELFLRRLASEMNKNLPMIIDKETELLNVAGLESTFEYNYRLVNVVASAIDEAAFADKIGLEVRNRACTDLETRNEFLMKGITMRYNYVDRDRVHVASLVVTPKACGL